MIVPVAKCIYICDSYAADGTGKTNLVGLFSTLNALAGFPYVHDRFCLFAQLTGGLGRVPFFFDIRHADTGRLTYTSGTRHLTFPNRDTIVQLALTVAGCRFERPGSYIVDLMCDNVWVGDTRLK